MTNPYESVHEFSSEQRKELIDNFKFYYQGAEFSIKSIGCMPYGCLISLRNGETYRTFCVDLTKTNNGNSVSVKVRPEGDLPSKLERDLTSFISNL